MEDTDRQKRRLEIARKRGFIDQHGNISASRDYEFLVGRVCARLLKDDPMQCAILPGEIPIFSFYDRGMKYDIFEGGNVLTQSQSLRVDQDIEVVLNRIPRELGLAEHRGRVAGGMDARPSVKGNETAEGDNSAAIKAGLDAMAEDVASGRVRYAAMPSDKEPAIFVHEHNGETFSIYENGHIRIGAPLSKDSHIVINRIQIRMREEYQRGYDQARKDVQEYPTTGTDEPSYDAAEHLKEIADASEHARAQGFAEGHAAGVMEAMRIVFGALHGFYKLTGGK